MKRFDVAWLVFWGILSSAWCLSAAHELSAAFDEPFYVRAGVESWRTGSNRELMKAGTMPLPVDVECLPLHLVEQFRGEPFELDRDFHRLLPVARGMNLLFWWLLLVYGMLLARRFGGPWAGRFAVVLITTEPNLLAHACLATTDIALAAMIAVFAYHYDRGRDGGRFGRWVLPGMLYGLAMTAKASALLFVPIVMLALESPRWLAAGSPRQIWQATSAYRSDCWKIFLVGIAFVFLYCGSDWKPQPRFEQMSANLPDGGRWTPVARWTTQHAAVFPNAGEAFHYQFKHNVRGHGSYLLGEWNHRAVWYYFPVALSIKLTVPMLALLGGLLIVRPRALCTSLGLSAMLLLLFSLNCRVQIGVRLVLPLVVFLVLAIAVGLARVTERWASRDLRCAPVPLDPPYRASPPGIAGGGQTLAAHKRCVPTLRALTPHPALPLQSRGVGRIMATLALVTFACLIPALATWPDGLRYGNELWGGNDSTYLHVSDSNADWGQGVHDLDRWTDANGLPRSIVWYYGRDPAVANDPARCLPLHMAEYCRLRSPADVQPFVRGKVVAVSTTLLYGNPAITESMPYAVEFFRSQQPVGRTRNYFVYDFRP